MGRARTFKATFKAGRIEPREPIEFSEGANLVVTAEEVGESRAPLDLWADYDPEKVKAAVRASAGTLTKEEAEELITRIYRARDEGSRPASRP